MTGPRVIDTRTEAFVREIGQRLRRERMARGYALKNVAARMGRSDGLASDVCQLERGHVSNLTIANANQLLAVYDLTLEIVPMMEARP